MIKLNIVPAIILLVISTFASTGASATLTNTKRISLEGRVLKTSRKYYMVQDQTLIYSVPKRMVSKKLRAPVKKGAKVRWSFNVNDFMKLRYKKVKRAKAIKLSANK